MKRLQSGGVPLIIIIVILVVVIIGALGFVFWQKFIKNSDGTVATISSFEACKAAEGSVLQETYPERCITKDGQSFTGPSDNDDAAKTIAYCTPAEKMCFDMPNDWEIKLLDTPDTEPGAATDNIRITSADKEFELLFTSGISGLGGTCPEEFRKDVVIISPTSIAELKGYEDEFHQDQAVVTRAIYQSENGKYVPTLYVTTTPDFAKEGTVNTCGIAYSPFFEGKNSIISSEFEGAGVIRFGYTGTDFYGEKVVEYDSVALAKAAYDTENYKAAAALLASSRYN